MARHAPPGVRVRLPVSEVATYVRSYFKPSAEAIAEVTSLLAPGDSRR